MKKIVYCFFGCVCFAFGGIGAVLPILPTFPFLLLAAFCFARSSERLHAWFRETKLYKENLEDYVAGNGKTGKDTYYVYSDSINEYWIHSDE